MNSLRYLEARHDARKHEAARTTSRESVMQEPEPGGDAMPYRNPKTGKYQKTKPKGSKKSKKQSKK